MLNLEISKDVYFNLVKLVIRIYNNQGMNSFVNINQVILKPIFCEITWQTDKIDFNG